jgi:signal transduction histidine kinase
VRRTFAAEAAQQDVALHVEAPAGIGPLMVDPQRMQQVLGNLVANSLRHTPAGGRIDLRAGAYDGVATIAVADTGSGIAPEHLPRLFERFYRVDQARSRAMGGFGLGLAISQWIAQAHGGRITVQSRLGRGSVFTVTLPLLLPTGPAAPSDRTVEVRDAAEARDVRDARSVSPAPTEPAARSGGERRGAELRDIGD